MHIVGSNWASRQGLTDVVRELFKSRHVRSGESTAGVSCCCNTVTALFCSNNNDNDSNVVIIEIIIVSIFILTYVLCMCSIHAQVKLSTVEEATSGIIGGALSTWNQPFEVLRIEAQAAAAKGQPSRNIVQTAKHIVQEAGVLGLFQGVMPRMGLCIWQTLFLVTVPRLLKPYGL